MKKLKLLSAAAAVFAAPTMAYAQEITTTIEGTVLSEAGQPIPGAEVTITDTRTNATRTITAGEDGNFQAVGLQPGGPYVVAATAPGFQGQTVETVFTSIEGASALSFNLTAATAGVSEGTIVVTAQRANLQLRAVGPGQAFGEQTLESLPSITRDIRDIIRLDPRVSLDRSNEVDRISCLGGNDRANAFTVDGIAQADLFGLNGTPFAARNALPLPYDVIRQTSVEFAPFDVEYGQFTGCAINVVTKSGRNKFEGSAFFTFRNQDLVGDELESVSVPTEDFEDKRYGFTLGGPIIPDRLFFYAGYEEVQLGDQQDRGPVGAGFANELEFVTEAQFNEISEILRTTYGIETGGLARALPEQSKRYFGRLDWLITDRQRLEVSYQRLEESNVEADDISNSNLAGLNTFEIEGTESNYFSGRFYSEWTDNFSTQLRASYAEVTDVQGPLGGGEAQSVNPIPRIIVGVQNGNNIGTVQAGPGFSRTANELRTEVLQLKALATYNAGAHNLTFGAEYSDLGVFNLFAQNATGTLTFANIEDLRQGLLACGQNSFPSAGQVLGGNDTARCRLSGNNQNSVAAGAYGNFTASGDINEAAAEFTRQIYTLYAQDEWQVNQQLQVLLGLRVDWFDGDAPRYNPAFEARYGFSNAVPFSNFDPILLPRLAVTYEFENEGFLRGTSVRAGVGRFTGGDPTVYFSNAFSNNGFSTGFGSTGVSNCGPAGTQLDVVVNGQFTGIPQCIRTNGGQQSARGLADTQSTDPNFKQPTVTRANIAFQTQFGVGGGFFDDWRLTVDYIYSRFHDPINFVDLSQVVNPAFGLNGFTVDGRPIYRAIDPTAPNCNAQLVGTGGTPPTYVNVTAPCFNTGRDDEIQITNGPDYDSHVSSIILSKTFNRGVFTEGGRVFFNAGYAYTDADNNRFNSSSTATSSFDIVAAFDRQNPDIATAEFETRHNFTSSLTFREEFFEGLRTTLGLVFLARSGRPYSLTFNNGGVFNDFASGSDNALLYIPTGVGDPNVVYADTVRTINGVRTVVQTAAQTEQQLNAYIDDLPCANEFRGRTIERNSCRNDWFYDLDLRFSQDLPGPGRLFGLNDRIELFADIDNFLNLIDSGSNLLRSRDYVTEIADVIVDDQGRYVISNFNPQDDEFVLRSASLWRIQVGIRYEF